MSQGLVWGDHLTTKTKKLSHGIHKVKIRSSQLMSCDVNVQKLHYQYYIALHPKYCIPNIIPEVLNRKYFIQCQFTNFALQLLYCKYPILITRWFSLMGFASFNPPRTILLTDVCFLANDFVSSITLINYFSNILHFYYSSLCTCKRFLVWVMLMCTYLIPNSQLQLLS